MTRPIQAPIADNRATAAWYVALLPRAFALFVVLHGLVHVIGFTVPWGLGGPRKVEYSTGILNGSVDIGDAALKALGVVWLAAAIAFVGVGLMLWRGHRWARRATIALLAGSLVLCTVSLPNSVMGLIIDVVLLVLLAVASDRLIIRSEGQAGV